MPTMEYVCKLKSYIQPFERKLALQELTAIAGATPYPYQDGGNPQLEYAVRTSSGVSALVQRLTFWEYVTPALGIDKSTYTLQVRREATTNIVRNGISFEDIKNALPFNQSVPLHNRRNLRYGTHGIHEYRGKFFPQLVKSLLNISGAGTEANVLDPMCGSGTTLVESNLIGANSFGVDQNPLSVFVSTVKCEMLTVDPEKLAEVYILFKTKLLEMPAAQAPPASYLQTLSHTDELYIRNWFSQEVLVQMDQIMFCIAQIHSTILQNFFKVALSNIIRTISWQKEDDLRVRKEVRLDIDIDVVAEYLTELSKSVKIVLAFLMENQHEIKPGKTTVTNGDAKQTDKIYKSYLRKMDVCITSPPYATALPYLDTDRLSLYYLGLMSRSEHRQKDYNMIGNRELTGSLKKSYLKEYGSSRNLLTDDILNVIDRIHNINEASSAGFRRKNLSALLARYFLDMNQVFISHKKLLKSGAFSFFIVGNNHTVADGERIEIRTDELLAHLGEKAGLKLVDVM
ncbi:MAG: hypothetical protein JST32_11050, partial [Bacteroidetes bacterium]|nr:hypothetical protein [Bacteroidota bacterium]